MRSGVWYTVVSALLTLLVAWAGAALVEGPGRLGAWLGAGIAFAAQVAAFWILFVWLLPQNPVLAHGLGMVGRILLVGLVALVAVPLLGLPAAPVLFSMVTVLFLTTLSEPVIVKIANSTRR